MFGAIWEGPPGDHGADDLSVIITAGGQDAYHAENWPEVTRLTDNQVRGRVTVLGGTCRGQVIADRSDGH